MSDWASPAGVHSWCAQALEYTPWGMIDGNLSTFWWCNVNHHHWVIFDLGSRATVSRIRWHTCLHDRCAFQGAKVYVSDWLGHWGEAVATGLAASNNDAWHEFDLIAKDGRYIKVEGIDAHRFVDGNLVAREFEFEGEPQLEPPPPEPPSFCEFLLAVGMLFIDLSLDIRDRWLIGEFLAAPFEWIGELFLQGAALCNTLFDPIYAAIAALEEGFTVEAFLAMIRENWPTLYFLITDPVGWFLVQLTLAFDLEPWHTQSIEFLAKWVLEEYFPALYQIWLEPGDWFSILLEDRFPILYYLVVDPKGEILYLIGQAFELTPYEAQSAEFIVKALFERYFLMLYQLWLDPEDWLVEHVDPRLLAVPEAIAAFLDDPWGWLFDRLEDRIETYALRIGEITLEIIAQLLGV